MAAILKVWRHTAEIGLHQSMRIYLKNKPAKFRPDLIWNDRLLGLFEERRPNNNNKLSSDIRSVPDSKIESSSSSSSSSGNG